MRSLPTYHMKARKMCYTFSCDSITFVCAVVAVIAIVVVRVVTTTINITFVVFVWLYFYIL